MQRVISIYNVDGFGQKLIEDKGFPDLGDVVENGVDVEALRSSLDEHSKKTSSIYSDIRVSKDSIDEFNEVISRVCKRGKRLKPFNRCVVRALKYGENKVVNLLPSWLLYKGLDRFSTQELVMKYCGFFTEQAEDFGSLFFHVVERESSLVDYSNELLRKNQFYLSKEEMLQDLIGDGDERRKDAVEKVKSCEDLSVAAKRTLVERVNLRQGELLETRKAIKRLVKENETAMQEIVGLVRWCSGMKEVLAFGKERMDNYSAHLQETLTTYLQAVSLNRGFRATGNVVSELAEVMRVAQQTADEGVGSVFDFIRNRGVYNKPLELESFF